MTSYIAFYLSTEHYYTIHVEKCVCESFKMASHSSVVPLSLMSVIGPINFFKIDPENYVVLERVDNCHLNFVGSMKVKLV